MTQAPLPVSDSANRALRCAACIAAAMTCSALVVVVVFAHIDGSKTGVGGVLRFREDGRGVETYGLVLLALSIAVVSGLAAVIVSAGRLPRVAVATDLAAKVLLGLAVVFMFAFPHLSQFEGKSLTYRAILYPTLALLPLAIWLWHGRRQPFPWIFDGLLTFALVFDIVSNDLHYYGTWLHWDDGVHYANSVPILILLVISVMAFEEHGRIRLGFWGAFIFAFCIYTSLHAGWEMEEFALDRFLGTNLQPGGMEEATRNNLAGLLGGITAIPVLLWWSHDGSLRETVVRPFAGLFGRNLSLRAA